MTAPEPRPLIRMAEELEAKAVSLRSYPAGTMQALVDAGEVLARDAEAEASLLRAADAVIVAAITDYHGGDWDDAKDCPSPACRALVAYRAAEKEAQGHEYDD